MLSLWHRRGFLRAAVAAVAGAVTPLLARLLGPAESPPRVWTISYGFEVQPTPAGEPPPGPWDVDMGKVLAPFEPVPRLAGAHGLKLSSIQVITPDGRLLEVATNDPYLYPGGPDQPATVLGTLRVPAGSPLAAVLAGRQGGVTPRPPRRLPVGGSTDVSPAAASGPAGGPLPGR